MGAASRCRAGDGAGAGGDVKYLGPGGHACGIEECRGRLPRQRAEGIVVVR